MSHLILALSGRPRSGTAFDLADIARLLVFVAIAMSGVVFSEPAPVDLVMLALIVVLPLAGLQVYPAALVAHLMLWLVCGAGAMIASSFSGDVARSTIHTGVSFYLYVMSFSLAAFVACRPREHTELILKASVAGAVIAGLAGFVGYFNLLPGAFELFTKFGRAAGTFKDPNVLGPFLVPAILYCAHLAITRPWAAARLPLATAAGLTLVVLLSFSRGAWINLALAFALFGYLAFVTAASEADRARILKLGSVAIVSAVLVVIAALQLDSVADLMAERSSLSQGYDLGPEGRFGGHDKAKALILDNPFGIGAGQFSTLHHHEDVHNVYLAMFLNAGWLGGVLYCSVVGLTLALGLRHVARATDVRPYFVIAFAAFVGNVVEGVVIDTDHWRHFYVLLALLWGMMFAPVRSGGRA